VNAEPDYVVMRASLDLPDGWMPPEMDGRWYDRSSMPTRAEAEAAAKRSAFRAEGGTVTTAVAVPAGRFEVRDDGAVAEVWEIRPGYR
jgi:hypothetical protein